MTTATLENPEVKDEPKEHLCGLSPLAPKAFIEIPVQTNRGSEGRPRWKTVQFAFNTIHYQDEADMTGFPRFGRVESLTKDEIEQVWEYLSHRVVRWFGSNKRDKNSPTIEGARPGGYGPDKAFSNGKVMDKRDERYAPNKNDEPLQKYIVLRPLTQQDRGVVNRDIPTQGGKEYYEAQLQKALAPVVNQAEVSAAQQQRILELEAMVSELKRRLDAEDDAAKSEAIDKREKRRKGR